MMKCFVVFCKFGYSSCNEKVLWAWTSGAGESQISIPLQRPKLLKGAILSIFPGCPLSCIPKTTIKRKSPKKRVVQSNIDSCVAPIVKISEYDQHLNTTNITSTLAFGFDEQLIFNVWDTLLTIEFPDSSWVSYQINEMKIHAQKETSSHLEPRSVVVKEVRVMKNYNEISQFILGKPFESTQKVSKFQLKTIVYSLYSLAICRGVSPEISYYAVHIMKKGYLNILNCCKVALASKVSRLSKDKGKNKSLSILLSSEKRKKVIRTCQAIRKSRIRLLHKNNQLEEMVKSYKHKIDNISEETIQQHIKHLNLNSAQGMVINECSRIGKFNSKTSRSPTIYKFTLKNEILPLSRVQTIKRHLSLIKLDFEFDLTFFEMFKKKINLKTEQQKYGVLIFDEMSVRVVDFGNDDIRSTKNEALADHALVFGFSSLCENYFQSIRCFAAKGATNGVTLAKLIVQAILLLEYAGAKTSYGLFCWRHYQILYNEEKNLSGNTRACPKLTESHVNPCRFAKMKVSFMTQIFSKSVYLGSNMYRERLTEELEDTWLNCWESEVSNKIVSAEQFLTKETVEGLRVTLHSTVDLIECIHSV
ncbi:Uncharacterized protein FWK35_00028535, partial [Aphis craccivora]